MLLSFINVLHKVFFFPNVTMYFNCLRSLVCWLLSLQACFMDPKIPFISPALIFCDNTVVVDIASNTMFHECTKHIELDCHFIQKKVVNGTIKLLPICSQLVADLFNKALPSRVFVPLSLFKMGMIDIYSPS